MNTLTVSGLSSCSRMLRPGDFGPLYALVSTAVAPARVWSLPMFQSLVSPFQMTVWRPKTS
jgi:hypothetical protein